MATQTPYNPQTDWRGCFGARIVPLDTITNPDMNGIMVGLATVLVNIYLRMHMVLSPADVEAGVIATLTQLYSILLSTLLSLGRQQLSLFDANYALTLTSSPFAIYLVYSSICNLFGFETHLFKSTESHRRFIGFFGALLLPIWVGLRLTLWFSTKAFKDSELCKNSSFGDFLLDLLLFFAPLTGPVGGVWFILLCLILASLLAIIGGWIIMVVGQYGDPRPDPWEWLSSLWTIFYNACCPKCPDHYATRWLLSLLLDLYWATSLIFSAYLASGKGYVVSYGQLLALFAAIPPFVSMAKLIYPHCRTEEVPTPIFIFLTCHWLIVFFWFPCWLSTVVDNAHCCIYSLIHNGPDGVCTFF